MAACCSPKPPSPLPSPLLVFFFFFFFSSVFPDQLAQKAALLQFRHAVGGKTHGWNVSTTPCSWKGVHCVKGNVTSLRISGGGLSGVIPSGVFGNLTKLRIVSLRYNNLWGPLPSDLAKCKELQGLHLHHNDFSGGISVVTSLKMLERLNLAHNYFSGEIPLGINELGKLEMLYLEKNSFSGKIPNLCKLSNLKFFNVSYNNLSGSIPPKFRNWKKDSFLGMPSLCGAPLQPCNGEGNGSEGKKLSDGVICGTVVGAVIVLIPVLLCFYFGMRKRGRPSVDAVAQALDVTTTSTNENVKVGTANSPSTPSTPSTWPVAEAQRKSLVFFKRSGTYSLEELLGASAKVLGKGTFGTSYKVALNPGTTVVVKRLKDVDVPEIKFKEKIEAVGKMDHPNVVPLRAYLFSKDEKILVYDYMPMGSLSALLHGNRASTRKTLDWETRLSIAVGAARGVQYIHSTGSKVSHGRIKSSNILLAKSDHARVTDHGLTKIVLLSSTANQITGYQAPEVINPRKVTQKADVYSFGILLLELLTGKAPEQAVFNEDGVDLPRWVQSIVGEEWSTEVFDLELLRDRVQVDDEMVQLLQLALDCSIQHPERRPTMSEVVTRIEEIQRASLDPDEV